MIKYTYNIHDYRYVLSFDLAKRVSGYTLLDFKSHKILFCGVIDTKHAKEDFIWDFFYRNIEDVIKKSIQIIGVEQSSALFITKEKLPTQNGRFSTIDTLQGLAQAHAIFDLAVYRSRVEVYDLEGIHSVSVKAYFKKILNNNKPQKEDIRDYLAKIFPETDFSEYPLDVTDSLAVSVTLLNHKYEADIIQEIRETKKEIKNVKTTSKLAKLDDKMRLLRSLME